MTEKDLKSFLSTLLEVPATSIDGDTDLTTVGLDSVRFMMTLEYIESSGYQPDFATFAEQPYLRFWLRQLELAPS